MLKTNKKSIIFFIAAVFFAAFAGCKTVPAGEAPERIIEIEPRISQTGAMSINEAVNFVSTELAINVFAGVQGKINLLVRNNHASHTMTRMVFNELKMFLPVVSVLDGGDFVLDSSLQNENGRKIWHVRLKDKNGKIMWYECIILKDVK